MRRTTLPFGSLLLLALCASAAFGQAQRTFVSGSGSDSNPCSRTAPCRTFAQAISQTSAGGEVLVLDSAGYGAFSINKSISIISPPGVYAGISVFSGNGITVSVGPTESVTLRGLSINNQNQLLSSEGVHCEAAGTLRIESCVVTGGFDKGIALGGVLSHLVVKDTVMGGGRGGVGIDIQGGRAILEHVTIARFIWAINVVGAVASIRDSELYENGEGLLVQSDLSGRLDAERCLITGATTGVKATGPFNALSISNCVIARNQVGFSAVFGAKIYTRGNNTIVGNQFIEGSLTLLSAQ